VMSLPATAQLSCQNCTRRKTKCDKQLPSCSACIKTGATCTVVQRQRLPRGRSARLAKSSSEQVLRERVDHLESIVSRLQEAQSVVTTNGVSTDLFLWQTCTVANEPSGMKTIIAAWVILYPLQILLLLLTSGPSWRIRWQVSGAS